MKDVPSLVDLVGQKRMDLLRIVADRDKRARGYLDNQLVADLACDNRASDGRLKEAKQYEETRSAKPSEMSISFQLKARGAC